MTNVDLIERGELPLRLEQSKPPTPSLPKPPDQVPPEPQVPEPLPPDIFPGPKRPDERPAKLRKEAIHVSP